MLTLAAPVLLPVLESIINHSLSLDPQTMVRLRSLSGKVIQLVIEDSKMHYYMMIHDHGLSLYHRLERLPDLTITGSWRGLWSLCRSNMDSATLIHNHITISGNMDDAHALQKIATALDIDWEEALAMRIGDRAAYRIGTIIKKAQSAMHRTAISMHAQLHDFLQYETGVIPTPDEVYQWMDAVSVLRHDVERAEARIQRLTLRCARCD